MTMVRQGIARAPSLRVVMFTFGVAFTIVAATGIVSERAFSAPSTTKYLVTVAAGAFISLLATVRDPAKMLVGIAVIVAPVDFVKTTAHVPVSPLLAVDFLAVLACLVRRSPEGRATVKVGAGMFALLVLPAVAGSSSPGTWTLWLVLIIVNGWLAFVIASEDRGLSYLAVMMSVSLVFQSIIAIWEFRTHHTLNLYHSSTTTQGAGYFFGYGTLLRPSGTLPDPIGLGQTLALYLPISVALLASARQLRTAAALILCVGIGGLALVLSLSRLSIFGGAVGIALALLLLPGGSTRVRTGSLVVAVVAVVALLGVGLGGRQLDQRVQSIFHPTARHVRTAAGDIEREHIWRAAERAGAAYALAGVGFGNITKVLPKYGVAVTGGADAQSTYLQFFAEGGIPGAVGLLVVMAAAVRDTATGWRRERLWAAGVAGSILATMLTWTTDVEVRFSPIACSVAILVGMAGALAARAHSARGSEYVSES